MNCQAFLLFVLSVITAAATGFAAATTDSRSVATPQHLENFAQNLPEAFSALEEQFKDTGFKSMLTSQLANPSAVEMFESLIHDPKAVSSISSLLENPTVKSSLNVQFASQYPTRGAGVLSATQSSLSPEATGDYSSRSQAKETIEAQSSSKQPEHSGISGRPQILVAGWLLTLALTALAPV
ncbi:hypothetical protein GGI12_005115 [Dipsacomyces acuminosporus]|nr:hypothetical protein GGI12_005115 [Dipsacomyces acuminosporus]